jgi:ubiquinone biosynthesis protein Coq4
MHKSIVTLRSRLLVFLTHHMALPLLQLIRKPQKFPYTSEALHQLPEGTLGKCLIEMLDKKGLKLLPYYAKHDIKHILLQYDTTDEGEVCLQCFMLGNKHLSFPVVATVIYGYITMPEHWASFRKAYRRGANCQPIEGWQWFTLLEQPVHLLTKKINK